MEFIIGILSTPVMEPWDLGIAIHQIPHLIIYAVYNVRKGVL
jgi:hypothetical protein